MSGRIFDNIFGKLLNYIEIIYNSDSFLKKLQVISNNGINALNSKTQIISILKDLKNYSYLWSHKETLAILVNENFEIEKKIKYNEIFLKNFLSSIKIENLNNEYLKNSIEISKHIGGLLENNIQIKQNLFMTFFQESDQNFGFCVWQLDW
jgi:hypothetical protein